MSPATRDRIVDAAMELFTLQGYAATGLAQIAKHANCNPGSVYYFFSTKEAILAATLERRKETLGSEVLDPIWEGVSDPIERIFALLSGYRRMLAMTEFAHGCPIGNLVIEVAETNKHARKLLCENFDGWLRAVELCFDAAIESGKLPADCDSKQLAIFVLTTMEGAVMLARSYRDFRAYDAAVTTLRDYVSRLERAATGWEKPAGAEAASVKSRVTTPPRRALAARKRRKP
jgi:TetR/AcrR family transcriptional regulator, transcriptional repressor for nem operon